MSCEKFIGKMFLVRDVSHSIHLSTRSYAKHMALGSFYDELIDLVDKFAEAYQGRYGMIGTIELQSADGAKNIVSFLEAQMKGVEEMRYKIVSKDDTALQNILDEIVGLFASTLYKLKFLA